MFRTGLSTIEDYAPVLAQFITDMNGNQPDDPKKAVEIIVDVVMICDEREKVITSTSIN